MERRSFLRFLGVAALTGAVDPERLLWTPKPMIVVPAMPTFHHVNHGQMIAAAWEEYVKDSLDHIADAQRYFLSRDLFQSGVPFDITVPLVAAANDDDEEWDW